MVKLITKRDLHDVFLGNIITPTQSYKPYRDFENLFANYSSERLQLENIENTWLANNFTGQDPDGVDNSFDDSENALFNNNYQLKIRGTAYQLGPDSLSTVGPIAARVHSGNNAASNTCFTNRHAHNMVIGSGRKFNIKTAINWSVIRASAKGKVVSFKQKGSGWKRARSKMAVYESGTVYDINCSNSLSLSLRKPNSGFKNRKSLKVLYRWVFSAQKGTVPGALGSSFETIDGGTGSVILQ